MCRNMFQASQSGFLHDGALLYPRFYLFNLDQTGECMLSCLRSKDCFRSCTFCTMRFVSPKSTNTAPFGLTSHNDSISSNQTNTDTLFFPNPHAFSHGIPPVPNALQMTTSDEDTYAVFLHSPIMCPNCSVKNWLLLFIIPVCLHNPIQIVPTTSRSMYVIPWRIYEISLGKTFLNFHSYGRVCLLSLSVV